MLRVWAPGALLGSRDRLHAMRTAVPRAVRFPGAATYGGDAALGHVALRQGHAACRRRAARLVRRGPHADARCTTSGKGARRAPTLDQGRGAESDRLVQS